MHGNMNITYKISVGYSMEESHIVTAYCCNLNWIPYFFAWCVISWQGTCTRRK